MRKRRFTTQERILPDVASGDFPIDPASLAQIPGLIHLLFASVRNIKLYPSGSSAILDATQQLKETIDKVLADNERLNITQTEKTLMVNGEPLDVTEFKSIAENFCEISESAGADRHYLLPGAQEKGIDGNAGIPQPDQQENNRFGFLETFLKGTTVISYRIQTGAIYHCQRD